MTTAVLQTRMHTFYSDNNGKPVASYRAAQLAAQLRAFGVEPEV